MPSRHHLGRKLRNEATAVLRKEAAYRRRKQKAKRLSKLEKAAK